MLFCVGNFFSDVSDASLDDLVLPLPTYILGPMTEAQARHFKPAALGGDLRENLTYLGLCLPVLANKRAHLFLLACTLGNTC